MRRVVHGVDAASSMSHEGDMEKMKVVAVNMTNEKLTGAVACSLILQGLGLILFSCVTAH